MLTVVETRSAPATSNGDESAAAESDSESSDTESDTGVGTTDPESAENIREVEVVTTDTESDSESSDTESETEVVTTDTEGDPESERQSSPKRKSRSQREARGIGEGISKRRWPENYVGTATLASMFQAPSIEEHIWTP